MSTGSRRESYLQDAEEWKTEIIGCYGSLRVFARMADISYEAAHRILNGRACTRAELVSIVDAWGRLDPTLINARANAVCSGERDVTLDDFRWLYGIYLDLQLAISRKD